MDLAQLVTVARRNGMEIIDAFRASMHVHNSIALYGTPEALSRTTEAWIAAGHDVESRKRSWYWPVSSALPRERWVEHELPRLGAEWPRVTAVTK